MATQSTTIDVAHGEPTRVATLVAPRFSHIPLPAGPDVRVKITEAYAKGVARDAYFWMWPMVNIYNRRLAFTPLKEAMRTGPLVSAPLNHLAMFTDYVDPEERGGIGANTMDEVIYYKGFVDPSGSPLSGDHSYTMHFQKEQLPSQYATRRR